MLNGLDIKGKDIVPSVLIFEFEHLKIFKSIVYQWFLHLLTNFFGGYYIFDENDFEDLFIFDLFL
jgi:hypothetical protein